MDDNTVIILINKMELKPIFVEIPDFTRYEIFKLSPAIILVGLKAPNISPICLIINIFQIEIFIPSSPMHNFQPNEEKKYPTNEIAITNKNMEGIRWRYIFRIWKSMLDINRIISTDTEIIKTEIISFRYLLSLLILLA